MDMISKVADTDVPQAISGPIRSPARREIDGRAVPALKGQGSPTVAVAAQVLCVSGLKEKSRKIRKSKCSLKTVNLCAADQSLR